MKPFDITEIRMLTLRIEFVDLGGGF
jgi:hypothetical protein